MDTSYFPYWNKLSEEQKSLLLTQSVERKAPAGTLIRSGGQDCVGFLLITKGRLRTYILSDDGKELTLSRLLPRDMCLFSAACTLRGADVNVNVEAEEDSEFIQIPAKLYRQLMDESLAVSSYTNELMAARFSDVIWLVDQMLSQRIDTRLAALLLEEVDLEGTTTLKITHEQLAHHLGSVREVITRVLRYFQDKGLVQLSRGTIELMDLDGLNDMAEGSIR